MSNIVTEGGCACGAIRYQVRGQPTNSMLCHCRTCMRAAGAPMVAWLTVTVEQFSFVRGTPAKYRSSAPVVRTFCSSCGTPLTYIHISQPTEVDVTICSLDDPDVFPPTHHSWVSHSPRWLHCNDSLPAHSTTSQAS
jgi:hypothetical protein